MLLRNRAEAEDAVQQTFLSAYTSLLNGTEPRHPAAWLATIARNECRARVEDRMRQPLGDAEPESTLPDPVAAAAARADLQALWQAIGELPRRQRKVLLLREFSGLSYEELAQALAVSPPTVESLLFRARRELRARLRPVTGSAASVAPLAAIRDALARAIGGMPDPSAGVVAGLVSATPVFTKVAAGVAVVAVAGGTVAAVKRDTPAEPPSPAAPPAVVANVRPAPAEAVVATPRPDRFGAPAKARVRRSAPALAARVQRTVVQRDLPRRAPAPVVAPALATAPPPENPVAPAVGAAPAPVAAPVEPAPTPEPAPAPTLASPSGASDDSSNSGEGSDDSSSGSSEVSGSDSSGPGSDDSSGSSVESSGSDDSSGPSGELSGDSSGGGEGTSGSGGSGQGGGGHDGHGSGSGDSGGSSGSGGDGGSVDG
jgi:RNA polymerase sigma factor (sigma-70 family)